MAFHVPAKYRVRVGEFATDDSAGNNGAFKIKNPNSKVKKNGVFGIIASDGQGWEHVSVSLSHRCPTWAEMCMIKDLFWDDEDTVMQFHPPKAAYVNNHEFCLHLWRPVEENVETPNPLLVGVKEA